MHGPVHAIDRNHRSPDARLALHDFCKKVGAVVSNTPETECPAAVEALLPDLLAVEGLLTVDDRAAPADGYGRNVVFLCPNNLFTVLAMVWPAGVETPIHDHQAWCAVGVYEGAIEESVFRAEGKDGAVLIKSMIRDEGACCSLPWGAPNIHAIRNPTDEVAISIHVYGGNIERDGPNLDRIYEAVT